MTPVGGGGGGGGDDDAETVMIIVITLLFTVKAFGIGASDSIMCHLRDEGQL